MSDNCEKIYKTYRVTQEKPAKLQSTVRPVTRDGTRIIKQKHTNTEW